MATIQLKPDFAIPAHFTGEQYITKAALLFEPRATVTVFADPASIEAQYRQDAQKIGLEFFQIYNRRHRTTFRSDVEARQHLVEAQTDQLKRAVTYLQSGLDNPSRVRTAATPQKIMTHGSTQIVREAYMKDKEAPQKLIRNIQKSLDWQTCADIREYFKQKGFQAGGKYVLLWGRRSGQMVGAGAYLDTNETMLAQMMIIIRAKDPGRKLVLIGDPIDIPSEVDGIRVPRIDIDLVQYWRNGLPGRGNVNAQFYFLNWLKMATDTVAIGTNSGILEIPHLLGMSTIYLENTHLHKRKGLRWQLLASKYEFEYPEGTIKDFLGRKESAKRPVPNVESQLRQAARDKVLVTSNIRPGFVRFSTTGATELWVLRKEVLGEIQQWMKDSRSKPLGAMEGTPLQFELRGKQDELLNTIIRASQVGDDQPAAGGRRVSYEMMHQIKKAWTELVKTREICLSPFVLQKRAETAIAQILRRHAFTKEEESNFWEVFNYPYVNTDISAAPDINAGMRAWLKDSEEFWDVVKNRYEKGSRVQQIQKEREREMMAGVRDWLKASEETWNRLKTKGPRKSPAPPGKMEPDARSSAAAGGAIIEPIASSVTTTATTVASAAAASHPPPTPPASSLRPPSSGSPPRFSPPRVSHPSAAPTPAARVQLPITPDIIAAYVTSQSTGTIIGHIQRGYRAEQVAMVDRRGIDLTINPAVNPPNPASRGGWNAQAQALLGDLINRFGVPAQSDLNWYLQYEARSRR